MITVIIQLTLMITNILLGESLRQQGKDYRFQYFAGGMCFMVVILALFKLFKLL
jgi:bacteriorhodopsin